MTITSQKASKKFFIDRIIEQAKYQNMVLSDAEKYMLSWSETDNSFVLNQGLVDQFNRETTDVKYKRKIESLLKSAYETDVGRDSTLKSTYREAFNVLNEGDYYLLVMIKAAIGSRLTNTLKVTVL